MNILLSLSLLLLFLFSTSCVDVNKRVIIQSVDWEDRSVELTILDSLVSGSTYLSTYSEIYMFSENEFRYLTVTVSLRNINKMDSVFIRKIEYFDTQGARVKSYITKPIHIAPMETVQIIIKQLDKEGGPGANFVFDWAAKPEIKEPLFEGVMVSHTGAQAFSFVTQGIRID